MADISALEQDTRQNGVDDSIKDEAASDDTVAPVRYDIASFGVDYDVEGLVRRLNRGDVLIPSFQRAYIWKLPEASRFIESLLLGLPIPGIFLAGEPQSNRLLVIDGQQRLKTLQFFYDGAFNPQPGDQSQRIFALTKVQERFVGKTYATLDQSDRLALDNSVIHATVVKQLAPTDDNTSIYYIFERLNSAGRRLTPQEMRCAVYHGSLMDELKSLNEYSNWRHIVGKPNARLKDQELILRFLALYYSFTIYQSPMTEFLNRFAQKYREAQAPFLRKCRAIFTTTVDTIWAALGRKAFRPERALNAAVCDSVMVGLAHRLQKGESVVSSAIVEAYDTLLKEAEYVKAVSYATSNEAPVALRIQKAIEHFERL